MKNISFFSAVYRDGKVRIADKTYYAGTFITTLLNRYYEDDTGARLAVFRLSNWQLSEQLRKGYISDKTFLTVGEHTGYILSALATLPPFNILNTCMKKVSCTKDYMKHITAWNTLKR